MQLKCCGARNLLDYRDIGWTRRNANALAPLTCCTGLRSDDNKFPPNHGTISDAMPCITVGNDQNSYHKQVQIL